MTVLVLALGLLVAVVLIVVSRRPPGPPPAVDTQLPLVASKNWKHLRITD